ncbi:zinc finger MIZ domain-containing protein 1-like protein [Dinothrombium tinctorium]|uniref:Zinc finger MIZ domain-containing protein 1-like protein n=1 Tax=Dinothrombium tinctorium TaxID=1965070 RepID=A0A3S3SQV7_9ACAR|nr:zinc finger MIZ domain-containing protein 1-like protein [Dinothrombium tinctorium]
MTANGNMGWVPTGVQSQQGPGPGSGCGPPHQQNGPSPPQLSVVATVWGMTTNSQSGPISHNYPGANSGHHGGGGMVTNSSYGGPITVPHSQGYCPPVPHKNPYHQSSQGMTSGRYAGYGPQGTTGMGPMPVSTGPAPQHGPNDYQSGPGSSALNAATLVAAATATATATARVVAMQERQEAAMNSMNSMNNMNAMSSMNSMNASTMNSINTINSQYGQVKLSALAVPTEPFRLQTGPGSYQSGPNSYAPNQRMNPINSPISNGPMGPMGNQSMTGSNSAMAMSMNPGNGMSSGMSQMNVALGMNGKSMSTGMGNVQMTGPQSAMNGYPGHTISGPGPRGRPSPYPNPQQYMAQKRSYHVNSTYSNGPGPGTMQATSYGPSSQQYNPNNQYPVTQSAMQYNNPGMQPSSMNYTQNMGPMQTQSVKSVPNNGSYVGPGATGMTTGMRAGIRGGHTPNYPTPPHSNASAYGNTSYGNQMNGPSTGYDPTGSGYISSGQYNAQSGPGMNQYNNSRGYHQHSPIPGNPTPPLTPASGLPYGADIKPNFGGPQGQVPMDVKPALPPHKDDELRLTFPVRDGVILPPFRLEHNLAVSNHVFHLKPSVFQTLMTRPDLELQLKCFHHEDKQMNTNWPASVQVSVNATPLTIDRGENKTSHKPLYLKEVCSPERNTIQITVSACCCSHLFLLHLVHRPTVKSVLQGLVRKRLLQAENCIAKIKRNFSNSITATPTPNSDDSGVEQMAIKVSLKCPITFRRITLPARGSDCKHIQCFDLESYLIMNAERGTWRCPCCPKSAVLEGLEVDQYMWGIITSLTNCDVEEVTIDASASWKPVAIKSNSFKDEPDSNHSDNHCLSNGSNKRFKAMSPNSTSMPTSNQWEMGQGLSPYAPLATLPDMQNINSGSPFDFHSSASDFAPLPHIGDNPLDPLAAMEKSLSQHEPFGHENNHNKSPQQSSNSNTANSNPNSSNGTSNSSTTGPQTPHTPHTPHTPNTPGNVGPPSVSATSEHINSDLGDLNFDPAAVIDGEGQGQEGLNLLPENVVDPMELLSYLEPPEVSSSNSAALSTATSSSSSNASNNTTTTSSTSVTTNSSVNDDILALFET